MAARTVHSILWAAYGLTSMATLALATPQNVTVDDSDTSGILSYNLQSWNPRPTVACPACTLNPDPNFAFNNTWHDNTWQLGDGALSMQFDFVGSAVFMYNIIPNDAHNAATNLTFVLDGVVDHRFLHTPTGNASSFLFNVSVYTKTGLAHGRHLVEMVTQNATQEEAILFDYAIYTTDPSQTLSASKAHASTIIGVVLGIAVLVIGVGFILLWRRRRARRSRTSELDNARMSDPEKGTSPSRAASSFPLARNALPYLAGRRAADRVDPYVLPASRGEKNGLDRPHRTLSQSSSDRDAYSSPTSPWPNETPITPSPDKLQREYMRDRTEGHMLTVRNQPSQTSMPSAVASSTVSQMYSAGRPQPSASDGEATVLREQMDSLWQEMARLRAVQEVQGIQSQEPLPLYEEGMVGTGLQDARGDHLEVAHGSHHDRPLPALPPETEQPPNGRSSS